MTRVEQLNSHPRIINKLIANETGSIFNHRATKVIQTYLLFD